MTGVRPVLKYSGAKWNVASWIVGHLPPHRAYLEPFFGSGAIFFSKEPAALSTINDLDGRVVNLFRVLRERPDDLSRMVALTPWSRAEWEEARRDPDSGDDVERARRFLVRTWQQIGARVGVRGKDGGWRNVLSADSNVPVDTWARLPDRIASVAARLRTAQIECRPALDVIARHARADTLIYADPPYPLSTRARKQYAHEMTVGDHAELLAALVAHPGPVVLSGYRCEQYDALLADWRRVERAALAEGGRDRVECLWLNARAISDRSPLLAAVGH